MTDEKKQVDQLSRDDLKEVKGGIPYEMPELIDFSGTSDDCGVGKICSKGGTDCKDGNICMVGDLPSTN